MPHMELREQYQNCFKLHEKGEVTQAVTSPHRVGQLLGRYAGAVSEGSHGCDELRISG